MSGDGEKDGNATRSKDGVPSWNGEASSYTAYEEAALLWEQGMVYSKRYTAAPRLMAELSGAAKRLVAGKPASEVAHVGGVRILLDYLRKALGKPRVNEVTDLLSRYFKGTRRRQGESMNDYITRKSEAFLRVSQALKRVQPYYQRKKTTAPLPNLGRRTSDLSSHWGSGGWSRQQTDTDDYQDDEEDDQIEEPAGDAPHPRSTDAQARRSSWGSGWDSWGSDWDSWRWGRPHWDSWSSEWHWGGPTWSTTTWSGATTLTSAWDTIDTIEDEQVLPSFIQGWYLLMDAALDSNERNLILTAINGDFTPGRVAQELRNQFPEGDLRRKDNHRRPHAFMGIAEDDMDLEEPELMGMFGDHPEGDLTEEGAALMAQLTADEDQAYAAFQNAKCTLKDARMRQHTVKLNRQYYRGGSQPGKSSSSSSTRPPPDDSKMECLRCGRIGHRAANCPDRQVAATAEGGSSSAGTVQQAPFVCFAESNIDNEMAMSTTSSTPTTAEAIEAGMAVVDGGATRTLGSVAAVEALLRRNLQQHGSSRLRDLDPQNRPVFGFGNSSENQCLSTCKIGVTAGGQDGQVQVHTLDCGEGPILLSVDALRSLGAVVDFRNDLMLLSALDNTRIIPLQRSSAGHQLLSLTRDLFQDAHRARMPVPDLKSYISP